MVAGICFLLLVSLTLEGLLKGFSHYVQSVLPGGIVIAMTVYLIFDFAVVVLLFAMIFKFLPDVKIQWRDVWIGAVMTAIFFGIGKWALGLYLSSGAAGSAYGAASSLITLLLWVYYSSQILLFGAEFTQVYADRAGRGVEPSEYAVAYPDERSRSRLRQSRSVFISPRLSRDFESHQQSAENQNRYAMRMIGGDYDSTLCNISEVTVV